MNTEQTVYVRPLKQQPKLFAIWGEQVQEFDLFQTQQLGRPSQSGTPDIPIPVKVVSRIHGRFETTAYESFYTDGPNTNGTMRNGAYLHQGARTALADGDVLRIHGRDDTANRLDVLLIYSTGYQKGTSWKQLPLGPEIAEISIGREETVALKDTAVSRRHASFFHAEKGWAIIDHGSLNGVFVNNNRITRPVYLRTHDVVKIAGYLFVYTGSTLLYQSDAAEDELSTMSVNKPEPKNPPHGGRVSGDMAGRSGLFSAPAPEAPAVRKKPVGKSLCIDIRERNVWHRMKKQTLLKDIRLEIAEGEMVLILGGSGAGKTTFMNAVMGYEQAEGQIRYNGVDIYDEYEKMKYEIGYVPQQDLLRMNDTVFSTLRNAAQMRLPSTSEAGYDHAVRQTLQLLGLEREQASLVGKLSGGQRKRLSIAVEYIGNPSLFFLDEPDSGLDGTMARALMQNLRDIADKGKIVLVISHSPDRAFELFDRVIVLAKGSRDNSGHLVFTGSPKQACHFFDTDCLEGIVKRINRPDEGGDGLADHYIQMFEQRGGYL